MMLKHTLQTGSVESRQKSYELVSAYLVKLQLSYAEVAVFRHCDAQELCGTDRRAVR